MNEKLSEKRSLLAGKYYKEDEMCLSDLMLMLEEYETNREHYIPKHETVEQWEERTGATYPDDGPVWLYSNNNPTYHKRWLLKTHEDAKLSKHYCKIVVANHHGKPEKGE